MQQNVCVRCRRGRYENVHQGQLYNMNRKSTEQMRRKHSRQREKHLNYFLSVHQELVRAHECEGLSLYLRICVSKDYEKCKLNFENHLVTVIDNNLGEMLV